MTSRFIQLHVLTAYPPSNLNRDDLGRPKSALVGNVNRLRVSSQSLKRAWRTSDFIKGVFEELGDQHLYGTRTRRVGLDWIAEKMIAAKLSEDDARKWASELQRAYGVPEEDDDKAFLNRQAVHVSPVEKEKLEAFVVKLIADLKTGSRDDMVEKFKAAVAKRDKASDKKKANVTLAREIGDMLLVKQSTAVDIALFGRMLAAVPAYNFDAAVQVAHAFTVNKATVQDDYFTAVDDLNKGDEDRGAGHIGETGFGSGVYYLYLCINRELLDKNLGSETDATAAADLRQRALAALVEAVCKVSPTGKQNSFASRCWASYALAEVGDEQPRSLSVAFLKPVDGGSEADVMREAIARLHARREGLAQMYEAQCADYRVALDGSYAEALPEAARAKSGSLAQLIDFVKSA